ncbi:VOC family protein [Deinococcus depolymerans]|uniref:VOC family protein n=1 Tax=Deinococcus depolymerans TaxID=392408 RepID=A0ABP3MQ09_9DEIO
MPSVPQHPAGTPIWFDLSTPHPAQAQAFYHALFGWTYQDMGPDYGHYHMVHQRGQPVAGLGPATPGTGHLPAAWTVYYASDDLTRDLARLHHLGGRTLAGPMQVGPLGHMLVATDPAGAPFGLWQPLTFGGYTLHGEHGSPAWQEVNTRNADQAATFYGALFGAQATPVPGDTPYLTLERDGQGVGGILQMDPAHWPTDPPPHWMPSFAVNDAHQAAALAPLHGGQCSAPPFGSPHGTTAVLTDPHGAVFSVIGPPAPPAQ